MALNILLVDDHPIVRQGLRQIIDMEDDMKVCGEASNAADALKIISESPPDLAFIDISLDGDVNGIELLKSIRQRFPKVMPVILSMHEESLYAERAIKAGARGYILKKESPKGIVGIVRKIMAGDLFLSEGISGKIISKLLHMSGDDGVSSIDTLSDREFEIFQMIGKGMSAREIAEKLSLSINTIESHKRHIKEKLHLKNSTDLVKNAVQWVLTKDM